MIDRLRLALLALLVFARPSWAGTDRLSEPQAGLLAAQTSTGVVVTPTAAPGAVYQTLNPHLPALPDFLAGQPSAVAVSPDGKTLLVLTSGFNRNADAAGKFVPGLSNEYVFVFDLANGAPRQVQALQAPDTFIGLAWSPKGDRFYVSGGVDDDVIEFVRTGDGFTRTRAFALGHKTGLGLEARPEAAGVAVSPNGRRLLVANYQNDSVSLIDLETGKAISERDLRPGVVHPRTGPKPGGTFPKAVVWSSNVDAFVAVQRDRELVRLTIGAASMRVSARLPTPGQPVALASDPSRRRLFAALDNSDALMVVDTTTGRPIETIPTAGPRALLPNPRRLGGVDSNALALAKDGRTVLVSNGGQNAIAVVRLDDRAAGLEERQPSRRDRDGDPDERPSKDRSAVVGLIPTGWYPTGVAFSMDQKEIFAVNSKSDPGPNPLGCRNTLAIKGKAACTGANQYVWQLQKGGLLSLPRPTPAQLGVLTRQVAVNNDYLARRDAGQDKAVMAFLHDHIKHVIFIVKENRTYDQVLGDLEVGNGDPKLAILGQSLTPNHHALAREFVTLDNFLDSGESSNTGWNWTTAARTNDFTEREAPVNYAARGLQYDQEGSNRNVNVGYGALKDRLAANPQTPSDPNILVGEADVAAPDGPGGEAGEGYLWNGALKAGLTVRNWGFYGDLARYEPSAGPNQIPLERDPYGKRLQVFFPTKSALRPYTDLYFRGFDQAFPDYWRFKEWEREFNQFETTGAAPNLMLLRLPHDHFGAFDRGIDGIGSVETEIADNDYAVGLVVQKVAASRFAADTLIFVIEDDAQDGPDHVNAHRSLALIVGPYVKRRAVISTRYTTVNFLRTIEDVLGVQPLNLNDAAARPMAEVFDIAGGRWTFTAKPSSVLKATTLPIPADAFASACPSRPPRSPLYWAKVMAGQDFSSEDKLDTPAFNRALWAGLSSGPLPTVRDGRDLSGARPAPPGCAGGRGEGAKPAPAAR